MRKAAFLNRSITRDRIIKGLIILCSGVILTGAVIAMKKEAVKITNPGNIDIFLIDKDICTVLITDEEIFAGGATGLFSMKSKNPYIKGSSAESNYEENSVYKDDGYETSEIGRLRYVRDIEKYKERILIAYDEGILVYENGSLEKFEGSQHLPDKRVNELFVDSSGYLWAGTWGGVVVFDGEKPIKTYSSDDGIAADMVNKIFEDTHGNIWLGSYVAPDGGVSILYNKEKNIRISVFTVKKGLLHANINDIILIDDSHVLAGGGLYNRGGVTKFEHDGQNWNIDGYIQKADGIAGEKVRSLMLDSKSNLWLGSEYDGLAVYNINEGIENIKILTEEDGLVHNEIKVMKEDSSGDIWIGTLKGLVKIKKGEFK